QWFAHISTLVINLDKGPENHSRRTQFRQRMVDFVHDTGLHVRVVGWDNRSSSFWPRSSDHFDHFGKHQSGIYMPQGPEFIRCD
ncbi:hypothetical protein C2W62_53795, partial [Candidatus Entotheonella serta]